MSVEYFLAELPMWCWSLQIDWKNANLQFHVHSDNIQMIKIYISMCDEMGFFI